MCGHIDGVCGHMDGVCGHIDGGCSHLDGMCGHMDGGCGYMDGVCGHMDGMCGHMDDKWMNIVAKLFNGVELRTHLFKKIIMYNPIWLHSKQNLVCIELKMLKKGFSNHKKKLKSSFHTLFYIMISVCGEVVFIRAIER